MPLHHSAASFPNCPAPARVRAHMLLPPQVVWVGTRSVGCAVKVGCSSPGSWSPYYVCQYWPPGNYLGQYASNVLPQI